MERLISVATGQRQITAQASLWVFVQSYGKENLTVICWDEVRPPIVSELRAIEYIGGSKPACHNLALTDYVQRKSDLPDIWFTMDDDIVLSRHTLEALERVLDADQAIGLASVFNCCSERNRGEVRNVAGEQVQFGGDFTVGGAIHAIPRRTLDLIGVYDETRRRDDDWEYTDRVRRAGLEAVIIKSYSAVVLPDDDVVPGYRDWINEISRLQQLAST